MDRRHHERPRATMTFNGAEKVMSRWPASMSASRDAQEAWRDEGLIQWKDWCVVCSKWGMKHLWHEASKQENDIVGGDIGEDVTEAFATGRLTVRGGAGRTRGGIRLEPRRIHKVRLRFQPSFHWSQ
jgi:hypothetical protein